MVAYTWVNDCNGYESACSSLATVQSYYPQDNEWYFEFSGSTTSGCDGPDSVAVASCMGWRTAIDYRTTGIYTVVWDNGSSSELVADSTSSVYPLLCPP
jgi:hypothetical protein